jgi:hypothetical protein
VDNPEDDDVGAQQSTNSPPDILTTDVIHQYAEPSAPSLEGDGSIIGADEPASTLADEGEEATANAADTHMMGDEEYTRWFENINDYIAGLKRNNPKLTPPEDDSLGALLEHSAKGEPVTQAELDSAYGKVVQSISGEKSDPRKMNCRVRRRAGGRRAVRRYIHARTQDLYNKNPGRLAKYIRDDVAHH